MFEKVLPISVQQNVQKPVRRICKMMGPTVSGGRIEGVPEIERNRNGRGEGAMCEC